MVRIAAFNIANFPSLVESRMFLHAAKVSERVASVHNPLGLPYVCTVGGFTMSRCSLFLHSGRSSFSSNEYKGGIWNGRY